MYEPLSYLFDVLFERLLRLLASQHTSAYVSIRQHTSEYVSIRQRTSANVSIPVWRPFRTPSSQPAYRLQATSSSPAHLPTRAPPTYEKKNICVCVYTHIAGQSMRCIYIYIYIYIYLYIYIYIYIYIYVYVYIYVYIYIYIYIYSIHILYTRVLPTKAKRAHTLVA